MKARPERNEKAARGYSRDQRPDCKQVNIGLVVTPEGLPIGYEVFAGNTADVTTVEEMVELMEKKYGKPKRIWVLDRGMVSEENIDFLRERGARYIVGTPKSQLKSFEAQAAGAKGLDRSPGRSGSQTGGPSRRRPEEQYMLCRSSARREKEAAMIELASASGCARSWIRPTPASQRRPAKDAGQNRAPHRALAGPLSRRRASDRSRRWNATQQAGPAD